MQKVRLFLENEEDNINFWQAWLVVRELLYQSAVLNNQECVYFGFDIFYRKQMDREMIQAEY